ncbi:MAG TPA: two-component regulator propeller domain-containing protein [Kofleriaceae bacterium]|nr:two-component regulator propeller domain-containing protein [Kofleriaceae bacterium]
MRAWAVLLGVVVELGTALPAYALDGHRRVTQYAQTHFGARDGMTQGFSNGITQTADGYLWNASQEGLSRFDGAGFTTFDARKTEGIPINVFNAVVVDSVGTLWAGTYDHGVLHVVDGAFHTVAFEPGPQEQMVRALAFDAGGDLWVGTHDRGVVRLHAGKLVAALTTHDGLPSDDIRSFLLDRDGAMWIGTFKGLARWKAGQIMHGPAVLEGTAVYAIAQDAQGDLWCGTEKGLAHIRGETVELLDETRLPTSDVHAVLFDRDGNLWIGTSAGAARMTPDGQIQRLPQPDAQINALFEDREGNLWIGSEKGLDRLFDGDMIPIGNAEGLTDEAARGVREDASGALWVASNVGLFMIPPGQTLATKIAPADRGVMYALYADSHGDIWVGSARGDVGRWHAGRFAWLGHQHWERVRSFAETPGGMWIGTNQGVFQLQGDRLEDARSIVSGVSVGAIVPDRAGSVWLATAGAGLMRWHDGAPARIPPNGPPRNSPVSTILFDPDGTMWVGTTSAGLWRLHDEQWTAFTSKDGMFDDLIWSTLDDGLGNFWMSSNRGIWRVSRRQLEARAAGLRSSVDSVVYGEADGMRDRECNGAYDPAGWRTRDGRLWFPTGKGLVVIDPAHLHASRPPGALIASVRVDGELLPAQRELVLQPGSGRLELAYTAPALRGPVRLRFRYRLEGFDHQWIEAGAQRLAQYTNLLPGDYKFIVEAGLDDQWGAAGTIAIVLPPRFYETGWFYALAVLSLALGIVAVPLLRVRQLRTRARELDQRVQEAIGELKVLSGLLPICAWCKKIRDDRGYWSKIEAYLGARTEAQFTHGICPECTEKMLAEESFGRSSISQGGRR